MQNFYGPSLNFLQVRSRPGSSAQGLLLGGGRTMACALGRSGIGIKRGEGDGITPRGRFHLLAAMIRPDRVLMRHCHLELNLINVSDGWCDAVGDRNYNRLVNLPCPASHEKLWRDDRLYDIVLVMDFNVTRRMSLGGSAIFFHVAREDYAPTEGCIAISRSDMDWLLQRIGPETLMVVE